MKMEIKAVRVGIVCGKTSIRYQNYIIIIPFKKN